MALNTRPVEQPTTDPAEISAAATSDTLNRIRHRYFSKSDLAKGGALDFRYYTRSAVDALLTAYVTASSLASTLAGYVTTAALTSALAAYTNTATLLTTLAGYALLAGRAGGQTIIGGTASGENLTLQSTSHATRGRIVVEDTIGTAWAALSYGSGWGDYGGAYQTGQVKKIGDMVFLRGLVYRFTGTGTTIATLPSGYRPPAQCLYIMNTNTGAGRLDIQTDGQIVATAGGTDWVQLDGLSFSIAA